MGSVAFDRAAGLLELLLVLASLTALLAALAPRESGRRRLLALIVLVPLVGPLAVVVWFASRPLERWPGVPKAAIAITVLAALTVAQPFGARAEDLGYSPPAAVLTAPERSPTATQSIGVLSFTLYRRENSDPLAGLGECCQPTHTVRARSWLLPGVLTNASHVADLCGDNPCWRPGDPYLTLRRVSGDWYVVLADPAKPVEAWRLSTGIVSTWGLSYWIVAALAITALVLKRRLGGCPVARRTL